MKENKIVPVTTESLKEELSQFSKETLIDMVDMWIQNYWVCQSYWVTYVERDFGYDAATRLDGEVFKKSIKIQARRLKALLGLGDDMEALVFALKHTTPQWVPAGFRWEFTEISDEKVCFTVRECPMGTFRKSKNLEVYPCKIISPPLYNELAKAINPRMKAVCVHAHPDPAKEDVMCQWEFTYEKEEAGEDG